MQADRKIEVEKEDYTQRVMLLSAPVIWQSRKVSLASLAIS
jgi:hypothetical protein